MRKLLILTIIILLGCLTFFLLNNGMKVLGYEVLGLQGINQETKKLDDNISKLSEMRDIQFKSKMDDLNTSLKAVATERKKYESLVETSDKSEIDKISTTENYLMEFLWVGIGNYATENKVDLDLVVTAGEGELKNLNFTAKGSYIGIMDFMYDLENDTKLQFKIEQFKLVPDQNTLKGTFVVKNKNLTI